MRKVRSKFFITALLIAILAFPSIIGAYTGSYSFDIANRVVGTNEHPLEAKETTTRATANTYNASGAIITPKSSYTVYLDRFLKSYSSGAITADGGTYTRSFGKVTKGNYTISVYKSTGGNYGDRVKGNGTINQ